MSKFTTEQVEYINKVKTFFTAIGEEGYGDDFNYSVYYVGDDLEMAKRAFQINTDWERAKIHVYVNGVRVKELERVAGGSWETTKDLANELTKEIDELQQQIFVKQAQLQIILGNVPNEG